MVGTVLELLDVSCKTFLIFVQQCIRLSKAVSYNVAFRINLVTKIHPMNALKGMQIHLCDFRKRYSQLLANGDTVHQSSHEGKYHLARIWQHHVLDVLWRHNVNDFLNGCNEGCIQMFDWRNFDYQIALDAFISARLLLGPLVSFLPLLFNCFCVVA